MGIILKSVKVKVLRYHLYDGNREIGDVYNLPEDVAIKLVASGKVEYIKSDTAQLVKEKTAKSA